VSGTASRPAGEVGPSPHCRARDPRSYIPAMALAPLVSAAYGAALSCGQRRPRLTPALRVAAVAWLVSLSLQTTGVTDRWRTREGFWAFAVTSVGDCISHYNVGLLHQEKGDIPAAWDAFASALELFPTHGQ
jgi:hypothetical protein